MPAHGQYGVISDIHANWAALKVALDYFKSARIQTVLCLGDLVGHGGNEPAEVLSALRALRNLVCVAGNLDRCVLGQQDTRLHEQTAQSLERAKKRLRPADLKFLKSLPDGRTHDDELVLVHGSLAERDQYILTSQEINKNLKCMLDEFSESKICFFGHTHIPMLISTKKVVTDLRETKSFQLDRNDIYLINPGSVGRPCGRCPLASFGIFDADDWTMTFVRQPYEKERGPFAPKNRISKYF